MKRITLAINFIFLLSLTAVAQELDIYRYSSVTYKLEREITTAIPSDIKLYQVPEFISMAKKGGISNAVIVKADKEENNSLGALLQKELSKAWKVDVPMVDWEEARNGNKNIILFGKSNYNMALRELDANKLLGNNDRGYELRTIPNALGWKKDVIYINGINDSDFKQAVSTLIKKTSNPGKIKFFIENKGWGQENTQKDHQEFIKELLDHYAKDDSRRNNLAIELLLAKPVHKYKMTGNDAYVKTFSEMMNMVLERYDKFVGVRKTPPTFEFHVFPTYLYNIENSKSFSNADRLKAIEFMRKIGEDAMNYWEMAEPMKFYNAGIKGYITNHSCFASRTVSSIARYLLTRYNYEPVRYWKEVADNGFDGVAPHPYSPEDAAGYQYLVYRIFVDYAITSGRYKMDFFRSPLFQGYLTYTKSQYNHLGYLAGYGDANAIGHYSSHPFLKQAIELFDDAEAKYLLKLIDRNNNAKGIETKIDLPPPGAETHGLSYLLLNDFKKEQYKIKDFFKTPLLDKAIFRSGWDGHADFLKVTGINGDGRNHGHFDANGISQYIVGDRLWIWEGDYIKKFPDDHNSMIVNRGGKNFDFRRNFKVRNKSAASQVKVALESSNKSQSLLSLLLEQYNGINWTRNINYLAKKGLWIIDEVDVLIPGDYAIEIYWRSLGNMQIKNRAVQFTQKPSNDGVPYNFFIVEGSGASRFTKTFFEGGHGRRDGNLTGYKKTYDLNTRQITQRRQGNYQKGDKLYYVNFLHTAGGKNPEASKIHKIADNVYTVNSGKDYHLAVIGNYKSNSIEIESGKCFMGPEGILASGAKMIKIGDYKWSSSTPQDIVIDYKNVLSATYLTILKEEFEKGSLVLPSNPENIKIVDKKIENIKNLKSDASSIAKQDGQIAIGSADGNFVIIDEKGKTLFEHKFAKEITAICPVKTNKGITWAVAVFPESLDNGEATLHLINEERKIAWVSNIGSWHKRNGTITTLFTAKLDHSGELALVAGSQSWHYYAFAHDTGKQIWRCPILHGATVGAAGDMDGDGLDDIALGNEYYSLQIANHKGIPNKGTTISPWNYSVVIKDLDGDGKKEAVFGRGDGWLYVNVPEGNGFRIWSANVGGRPIAIVDIENDVVKLAVATELGDIVYLNSTGKIITYTKLPAQLTDLKLVNKHLLATCLDGYSYLLDLNGKIISKSAYNHDVNSLYLPKIAAESGAAVFYSGKNIYLIKQ